MTEYVKSLGAIDGYYLEVPVFLYRTGEIALLIVDFHRHRSAGETRSDRFGDL